jgi:3-oxoacyl-[acyl-carrier protein] reductase
MSFTVVIGGRGSLGVEVVKALIQVGYQVIVVDKAGQPSNTVTNNPCDWYADLLDIDSTVSTLQQIAHSYMPIRTIVYCAGILERNISFDATPLASLLDIINVNLSGAICTCHTLIPFLKQAGGGSIILIASITAFTGSHAAPTYAVSKAGLLTLAKSLAKQYGRFNIRVNCISPGSISASSLLMNSRGYSLTPEEAIGIIARSPLARLVTAEEVANAVLFLCSEGAKSITGTNLVIDGGESLGIS